MTRLRGRSLQGERLVAKSPHTTAAVEPLYQPERQKQSGSYCGAAILRLKLPINSINSAPESA